MLMCIECAHKRYTGGPTSSALAASVLRVQVAVAVSPSLEMSALLALKMPFFSTSVINNMEKLNELRLRMRAH